MSRIAVTGGAGFVGSNLVARLIREGHDVVIVDDLSTGLIANLNGLDYEFYKCSILDDSRLDAAISDCEIIFHLAARGSVPRSIKHPVSTHDVNATGTLNVMEIARKTGAHVVFSSSSSVYGRNTQLPKNERMWLGPISPYAASKLAAEAYVQAYAASYEVPTTILRFFNIFGPHQRPDHEYAAVLPKWIWLATQNRPIEVYGDVSSSRDFTYIDTVMDIAATIVNNRIVSNGPVNLAYGNRITLEQTIELLRNHFPGLRVNYLPKRPGDIKDSQNDPTLLYSLFPEVKPRTFEDGLAESVEWIRGYGPTIPNPVL